MKSGIIKGVPEERIESPELYVDSKSFMSWEQYFTDLLGEYTKDSDFAKYKKNRLPEFYLQEKNVAQVRGVAKGIKWE